MASIPNVLRSHDREFFDLFERAGANIVHAAELLQEMLDGYPETSGLARDILICEQNGDHLTHEVIQRINHTFVTPIDREDIFRLVSALDDIVDYTEEVADYLGLLRIEAPMAPAQQLARVLRDGTVELAAAITKMRNYDDVERYTERIHGLEDEGDRISRAAIASLFESGIDPMTVIRWKDIYERLESAIDATERAADVLEAIVIKNA
jgi:predicted phosphate transport protein (TIGR00153 family)